MPSIIDQPLVPKRKARHLKKTGRTSSFRDKFWQEFDGVREYERRIQSLSANLKVVENYDQNQQIYFEAGIDFESVKESKGATPEDLWDKYGLDIVASSSKNKFVISGSKSEYSNLKNFIESADFSLAKSGFPRITRKEMNAYREIYALSTLSDQNTIVEGRVDNTIEEAFASGTEEKIDCIIEFRADVNRWEYDRKFALISQLIGEEVLPASVELIIHNMFGYTSLTTGQIRELLSNPGFSFIQFIRSKDKILTQRLVPNLDLNSVVVGNPESEEVIGVIDSGVESPLLNKLRFDSLKIIPNHKNDYKLHGTFVTSRVIFGNDVFSQCEGGRLTPLCRFLDIQVLYDAGEESTEYDELLLRQSIDEAFRRYEDVVLYNLSLNLHEGIKPSEYFKYIHPLTEFIDARAREYDKLPIISVGNQFWYQSHSYNDLFGLDNHDIFISVPSDALNALSVGSIVDTASDEFHCEKQNYPSPFTRKGGIRNQWKKPELTHWGGNILLPNGLTYENASYQVAAKNKGGVEGIFPNKLGKDYGTSQSTPLVSREAIKALSQINKYSHAEILDTDSNKANLVKASLIHSTAFSNEFAYKNDNLDKCVGFGIPNGEVSFKDNPDKATIIYADKIDYSSKKHSIVFEIPDMLVGSMCKFTFTLVYNPPVNKNFPKSYNQLYLTASPKFLFPDIKDTGEPYFKKKDVKKGKWSWNNYSNHDFSSIHFSNEKKVSSNLMEIIVQLFARQEYEKENIGHEDAIFQHYALILTIEDLEERGVLKEQLVISDQFNQIEVEVDVEEQVAVS